MKISKPGYIFEYAEDSNEISLYNKDGRRYAKMPASVLLQLQGEDVSYEGYSHTFENDCLTVFAKAKQKAVGKVQLAFALEEESIVVSFSAQAKEAFRVHAAEFFRNGSKGMYMVDCIRYFAPAPRNNEGINRAFYKVHCDCTMNAYFAPPPLNFCIGNQSGWVAFGLLDLPDSYEYKMTPQLGILAEKPGGKLETPAGGVYTAPRLLITFPETEWDSISLFREKLAAHGMLPQPQRTVPQWWHKPLIVTYGDQMMELQYNWYSDADWGCPAFTLAWLEKWLERAEQKLGFSDFTVVIDAFWQYPYSAEPRVDETRFRDLRGFIDRCHEKGHHVLLWVAPLLDNPDNGFETLAQQYGVLSPDAIDAGIASGKHYIDFTSQRIDAYFLELSRRFFSDDPDALNCDGLKMDFLASLRNPEGDYHYQNPENGLGIKEMYRFYDRFQQAATQIKPDVLLNGSGCDPRFETLMAMNRLHDIQNVYEERELRARASVLACPGLLVDSDGAIMLSSWVFETYINAVVYATPSLYYVNRFHDGLALDDDTMAALGRLLWLSGQKTGGRVVYDGQGSWRLLAGDRVTAETLDGKALFVFDGKKTLYVFSWESGSLTLPRYDYKFKNLPANFALTDTHLTAVVCGGKLYALEAE